MENNHTKQNTIATPADIKQQYKEGTVRGSYNFNQDIIVGEEGEDDVIRFMQQLGFKFVSKNKDNRFDVLMEYGIKKIKYEIKTDLYPDTGNLVVEFECRGKPSGIAVSESDYFVTYFHKLNEIWNIKTDDLRDLIVINKLATFENAGDDGSKTKLYKIPKEQFKSKFNIYRLN